MTKLAQLWYLPLIAAIPLLQRDVDRRLGAILRREPELYLRSGEPLKALAPGFEDVLADLYWIRTVLYFGEQRVFAEVKTFDLLYPLVDIATTLDRRLVIAYKYGAVFLCEPKPMGKGDPEKGIRILEKGVLAMPENWRLRQDLGYFRYVFMNDAKGAARELLHAAKLPGAPGWLTTMADIFLQKGEDRQTAKEIWRRLYEDAEEEFLKERAVENLQRLDGLDTIDAANARVDEFVGRHRRSPRGIEELTGIDPRSLVDPTGVALEYHGQDGTFWFSQASRLWRGKPSRPRQAARAR